MTIRKEEIGYAPQGVRQRAVSRVAKDFLTAGDIISTVDKEGKTVKNLMIQEGTVGIVHYEDNNCISIIRDDCQAARKAAKKRLLRM